MSESLDGHIPAWFVVLSITAAALAPSVAAQHFTDTTGIDPDLEALVEPLEDAVGDPTQLVEVLSDLVANPLDVNRASVEQLALLPFLGPVLAQRIVAYRRDHGRFGSTVDLLQVEGFTSDVLEMARPYVTVDETTAEPSQRLRLRMLTRNLRLEVRHRMERRLDVGRGYGSTAGQITYRGSPERLYTRVRVRSPRHLSLNLTLEKDPGEAFRWEPGTSTYGYDYMSGHVALSHVGRLRALVLGDYVASFGQGLVLWRGSAFGKGPSAVRPLARTGTGLIPYGSTDENAFFRGLALTVALNSAVTLSVMASARRLDARLVPAETSDGSHSSSALRVASLLDSGLHRTASEMAGKDAAREQLLGGNIAVRHRNVRAGLLAYRSRFGTAFEPGDKAYQRYQFSGDRATMAGVYGNVFLRHLHIFGEIGLAPRRVVAGVGGVLLHFPRNAEMVILVRHYPPALNSFHGHAFGERNGLTQNETGYYVGLRCSPLPRWHLAAYVDQYRFPWVRFGVPRPTSGTEVLVMLEHRPHRWFRYYLQLRSETREAGQDYVDVHGRRLDAVIPETRRSLRLQAQYFVTRNFRVRTRAEQVRFASPTSEAPWERGFLIYQDLQWAPVRSWRFDFRLTWFRTDSYDTRIHAYEQDLLHTFAVPALSGRGRRLYLVVRWEPLDSFLLQAKGAVTILEGVETVGSGLDMVTSHRMRAVRLLARFRL